MKYTISENWTKTIEAEAGWDSPYGLEWADIEIPGKGDTIFQGAWRVVNHVQRTEMDTPTIVQTYQGQSARSDSRRLVGDLNMSAMFGTGVNR